MNREIGKMLSFVKFKTKQLHLAFAMQMFSVLCAVIYLAYMRVFSSQFLSAWISGKKVFVSGDTTGGAGVFPSLMCRISDQAHIQTIAYIVYELTVSDVKQMNQENDVKRMHLLTL